MGFCIVFTSKRGFRNQFRSPFPKVREPHFLRFGLPEPLLTSPWRFAFNPRPPKFTLRIFRCWVRSGPILGRTPEGSRPDSPYALFCRVSDPSPRWGPPLREAKPGGVPNPGVSHFFWERSRLCRGPFRDCSS